MMKCDALWEVGQGLHTSEKAIWLAFVNVVCYIHTHTHVNGYCIVYNTSSSGVAVMIAHAGRQAGRCTLCVHVYRGITARRGPVLC